MKIPLKHAACNVSVHLGLIHRRHLHHHHHYRQQHHGRCRRGGRRDCLTLFPQIRISK